MNIDRFYLFYSIGLKVFCLLRYTRLFSSGVEFLFQHQWGSNIYHVIKHEVSPYLSKILTTKISRDQNIRMSGYLHQLKLGGKRDGS